MQLTPDEVAARQPVWEAMSWFYRDDNHDPSEAAARICAASAFSLDELETIFFEELHPVLAPYLSPVAMGAYGLDEDWLRERILNWSEPIRVPSKWLRRWVWPWRQLRKGIVEQRNKSDAP